MNTVLVCKDDMEAIVGELNAGHVVSFPTETVFGLGVRFGDLNALNQIYQLKSRSSSKAVTLMVSSTEQIKNYAYVDDRVQKVIDAFMPGMITLILKKKEIVDDQYTASLPTIGIRIPNDEFVLELLNKVGPMMVTSANISNMPDLLNHEDVYSQFKDQIPLIVEGQCVANVASTVALIDQEVTILREGLITKEMIEEVLM